LGIRNLVLEIKCMAGDTGCAIHKRVKEKGFMNLEQLDVRYAN